MANPFSYEGKRVVLTGAYSGVGAALLELLDELGAEHITVIDLKEPSGPASKFVQADLSSEAAVDAAVAAIDGPVHALFNNAGVAGTMPVNTVMAVNYLAVRKLTEGLRDRMAEGSAIAITASIAGGSGRRTSPRSRSCSRSRAGTSPWPGSTRIPTSSPTRTRCRRSSCRSTR